MSFSINLVLIDINVHHLIKEKYQSAAKYVFVESKYPTIKGSMTLVSNTYLPDALFMIKVANQKNIKLDYKNIDSLSGFETVFTDSKNSMNHLMDRFNFTNYYQKGNLYFIQLIGKK